jgi:hypothetical protein
MKNLEIDQKLNRAVDAYKAGQPVVVLDEEGHHLHGEDFLKGVADLNMPMRAFMATGIPRAYFEATDWPEVLEAARQVFFLKNRNA